jgi:hypothetical protein
MTRAGRQPPSRARYAAAHPTIGIHVDRATYDRLLALRDQSGLSFAQLILRTLGEVEFDVHTARRLGKEEGLTEGMDTGLANGRVDGYADAVGEFRVTYSCAKCGVELVVRAGSPAAKAATGWLLEKRWGHRDCPGARDNPDPKAG